MPTAAGMRLPDLREDVAGGDVAALAALLADVVPADASSMDLLARVVGWGRVAAMAQGVQARVIGELVAREQVGPDRAVDELQCALTCTRFQAQRLVVRAQDLASHPTLLDALARADVDLRAVDAVLEGLPPTGEPRRWDGVVAGAIEAAATLTAPALRRQVRRHVLAVEPGQAAARAARALDERCVQLHPADDAMAWISALLPAPDAAAVFTVVDALAGTVRVDGDTRTADHRRADAFAGVFGAILETGALPDGSALPRRHGRRASVQVTVPASTLLGLDELPGELAGYGPIPADVARRIAQDATWRRLLTDPVTGVLVDRGATTYRPGADLTGTVIARDATCTYPGCGQPAERCDLDHVVPFGADRPADQQTILDNVDAKCRHHHQLKTHGGWSARRIPESGASEWTDPLGITFIRLAIPIAITPEAMRHLRHPRGEPPGGSRVGGGGSGTRATPGDTSASPGYPDVPPF